MSFLLDKDPLVVVGDAARVRLFCVDQNDGHLVEIEDLVNTAAHLNSRDLQSDREGRAFDSVGAGRHSFAASTDVKEQASIVFAREVAAHLQQASDDRNLIVLISAPRFLGLLRKQLTEPVKGKVTREINKDLTTTSASEIETIVTKELRGF